MRTMRTVPMALMAAPVVGSASTEPSAMASSTRPSCPLVRSKLARTSGMRETQLAKTSPLRKNVSPTALRAAVRVGTVLLLGYTGETFRSNRFDAIVRNVSGPTRTPTMVDVAAAAGVSLSTASLAFSGNKPVSAETRDRVLAAAGALGYAGPNPLARNLRRGRSGVVGVAVGRLSTAFRDPAALPMLDAVSEVLDAAGLGLLLMPDGDEHAGLPLDAVIYDICGCETWGPYDDLVARGVPLVVVEGPAWPGATYVDVEHRRGAADVARHLHDLGHRRVATLTLDPSHPQREREAGLRDVYPDAEVIGPCASDLEAAQRAVGAWWDGGGDGDGGGLPERRAGRGGGARGATARDGGPPRPQRRRLRRGRDAVARPRADDRRAATGREGTGDRAGRAVTHRRRGRRRRAAAGPDAGGRLDGAGAAAGVTSGGSSRCRAGRPPARTGSR